MSTTGTTTPRSVATSPSASDPGRLRALLRHRTVRRLLPLAAAGAVLAPLAHVLWGSGGWPDALSVSLDGPLRSAGDWIVDNRDSHWIFLYFFGWISAGLIAAVHGVYVVLLALGWAGVTAGAALIAWRAAGVRAAVTALASFAACGLLDMWVPTMRTLALMAVAVAASVVVGALLGLAAGLSERAFRVLRPVLDTMQALPAFAYLLPVVLVFGIGVAPAVLATVVYAAPPMARLTALGLRSTDRGVLEAVDSLGATPRQRLLTARLPLAREQLLLGVNQAIMMALSMAVIASVIGADGLGDRVYQALSTVDVGAALAAGIPIVLLAIVMDRTTSGKVGAGVPQGDGGTPGRRLGEGGHTGTTTRTRTATTWALGPGHRGRTGTDRPHHLAEDLDAPDREAGQPGQGLAGRPPLHRHPGIGGTADWAAHYTGWIVDPLRDGLTALPGGEPSSS
ncbi:hypothetical protein GCM10020221_07370 [Streptomyces thioluteus]|uniref:ABC transmembrane type-1 domain-containing protein n=1 Tax=Streptomyces thioluteus TaxID=66431 RepID=A0ABN3WG87_STRTU